MKRTESNEFLFKRPDGQPIEAAYSPHSATPNPIGSLQKQNDSEGLHITSDTGVTKWDGVPMDYHMAVDELLVRRGEGVV